MSERFSSDKRALTLDALRGVVMILMAYRHAEIFLTSYVTHPEMWGGVMPDLTFGVQYWTRFFGHMCPTGFFFLMGVGMTLFARSRIRRGWTNWQISSFFIKRGALLVLFQFVILNPLWYFDNPSRVYPDHVSVWFYFGVLFSLGMSFMLNSLILRFNSLLVLAVSFLVIIGTQFIMPDPAMFDNQFSILSRVLYIAGQTGHTLVLFPVLPWLGFTGLGILFGRLFIANRDSAYRLSLPFGLACVTLFLLFRFSGGFGNFRPYAGGDWQLLFYISKHPPSLAYVSITFGEIFLLIWILSKIEHGSWRMFIEPLGVYGRCSLFFYITHIFLFACMGQIFFRSGAGLLWMFIAWLMIIVAMYPICKWYGQFKRRKPEHSLWRFF